MKYIVVGRYSHAGGPSHVLFEVEDEDAAKNAVALLIKYYIVDKPNVCYFPKSITNPYKEEKL